MFGEKGLGDSLKGYTSDVREIAKYLGTSEKTLDRIVAKSKQAGTALDKVVGNKGNKNGKQLELGTNNAQFSNDAIHDRMLGSMMPWLDKINALQAQQARSQFKSSLVMGGIDAGMAVVGGVGAMMPSTGPVIQQATNYYNAAVMSGFGGTRKSLEQATFSGMRGGITSPGSPGAVAQFLSMQGMNVSTATNSTYNQTLGAVGNAAKYLNMDNMAAAQAISGFTSGAGSKNLMQRLGIFTSDPRTGKERSVGAIMQDIGDRLSNGRKLTVQGVNDSFRRGNLGQNLKAMNLTEDQQQLVKQYLIEKAKGNNMDLSNNKAMDALMKKAGINNKNPQSALQKINASNTKAMQTAEEAYISGMNAAADSIEALNSAINNLTPTIGGLKSYFDTLKGSNAGSGAMDMGGKLMDTAMNVGTTYMMMRMLGGKGFMGGGSGAGGLGAGIKGAANGMKSIGSTIASNAKGFKGNFGKALKGIGKTTLGKLGIAGSLIGGGMTAAGGIGTKHQGADIGRGIGEAAGSIGGWAAAAALAPETGGLSFLLPLIGSMGGSKLLGDAGSWIGGMFDGGTGGDLGGGKRGSSSGGAAQVSKGANPTETTQLSKGGGYLAGTHEGIDFAVDNKKVFAAYAGEIVDTGFTDTWGKYIIIDHGKVGGVKLKTRYQHLSSIGKTTGQVGRGQQIGVSGKSGKVTGAHLHFAVYENGSLVNPVKYVNAVGGAGDYAGTGRIVPSADTYGGNNGSSTPTENPTTTVSNSADAASMSISPISFRQSAEFSDLLGMSSNGVSGSSLTTMGARMGGVSLLTAIKGAGFKGKELKVARAVALASSGGNANKHLRSGGHDRYGLFQIDMNDSEGNHLRKAYMLKNAKDALDPVLNARMAYDLSKHGTDWTWNPKYKDNSYQKYLTGGTSASAGINYVSHDQPVNVHAGEAILDANQAREYRQNKMIAENSKKNNVVVNVTVAQASEAEARRLAELVKKYLDEDSLIDNVRSF